LFVHGFECAYADGTFRGSYVGLERAVLVLVVWIGGQPISIFWLVVCMFVFGHTLYSRILSPDLFQRANARTSSVPVVYRVLFIFSIGLLCLRVIHSWLQPRGFFCLFGSRRFCIAGSFCNLMEL